MTQMSYTALPHRSTLLIKGNDRLEFLQGLISNDINKVTAETAIYAAFLTPQGKFLCDFFIAQKDQGLLIDIETATMASFKKKLSMYKLRADVTIEDVSDGYETFAIFGQGTQIPTTFADPRLTGAGYRAIIEKESTKEFFKVAKEVPFDDYETHRIKLGLPDGSRDMIIEKSILLENGFDELNGVDWDKGCYMGQELTARTKYRALIKKRLFPVNIEGDLPAPGTEITCDDKTVGQIQSGIDKYALATIKLDARDKNLQAGNAKITVVQPSWMVIAE